MLEYESRRMPNILRCSREAARQLFFLGFRGEGQKIKIVCVFKKLLRKGAARHDCQRIAGWISPQALAASD
jgi:hypothetical protein